MNASYSFEAVESMYRIIRCHSLEDHKWVEVGVYWMLGSQERKQKNKNKTEDRTVRAEMEQRECVFLE
jgi:hypothetical protein